MTLQERYEDLVDEFTGVDGVTPGPRDNDDSRMTGG